MSDIKERFKVGRYRELGLLTNPFALSGEVPAFEGSDLEIGSGSNQLLGAIAAAAEQPSPKPIAVIKDQTMPAYYHNRAVGRVERSLATDNTLELLHAYVPMFMLRLGRVRATLQTVGERLAFRQFDQTLALYVEKILAEPDDTLIAYQMLGEEGLAAFTERFKEDPRAVTNEIFGKAIIERRPELKEVGDIRAADLVSDVDEEDDFPEIDETIGNAPGTEEMLAEEIDSAEDSDPDQAALDYVVEYTKVHLSPVIARALRVYKDRGQAAMITEFTITKAPRKTLSALVQFARVRFTKVVLMWDQFEGWPQVPADTRIQIAQTLSELRWMLESDAIVVVLLEEGIVNELEEQFAGGTRIEWRFPGVLTFEATPDLLDADMVNGWLASATAPGATPLTLEDKVLGSLFAGSEGSLTSFAHKAALAIESAAERGVSELDEQALAEAMAPEAVEAESE